MYYKNNLKEMNSTSNATEPALNRMQSALYLSFIIVIFIFLVCFFLLLSNICFKLCSKCFQHDSLCQFFNQKITYKSDVNIKAFKQGNQEDEPLKSVNYYGVSDKYNESEPPDEEPNHHKPITFESFKSDNKTSLENDYFNIYKNFGDLQESIEDMLPESDPLNELEKIEKTLSESLFEIDRIKNEMTAPSPQMN